MTAAARPTLMALLAVAVLSLGVLVAPRPALAMAVDLRSDISAPDGRVTLGDLFEDAGAAGQVLVASGGQAGGSLVLDARHVQALAAAHGLVWANERGLNRLIAPVDAAPVRDTVRRRSAEVLTYARDFAAGELVEPEDIVWAAPSGFAPTYGMPRDSRSVIGQSVRRPIRAGTAVALSDLSAPRVIKKDEIVQVAYAAGGIRLVLQGKAMTGAALGDSVDILNPASRKIIQAIASGPDEAVVGPTAAQVKFAAANPKLFASLN